MKKILPIIALSGLILSGCVSTTSNQQRGAVIGGVVGAIAGKGTGDHAKSRYVWGAALGALAGATIGTYMDKQEEELRRELSDTGVQVSREGDNIKLHIPGNITFASGKANIVTGFYPVLDDVALVLNKYTKTRMSIDGHTDSIGDASYNQQLSINRANSVAGYLAQAGVDSRRLQTTGYGESVPIATNINAAGRQKNRRVELRILPIKS